MNWNSLRPWLGTLVRLTIGVVLLVAGWAKLHDPRAFVQTVRAYDATPEWLSQALGYGLPVLEVCLGVLLIVGIAVRISAVVSAVLFLVFLIGLVQAAGRSIRLDCGCFGASGGTTIGATHYTVDILRDVALLVIAVYLALWSVTRISIEEFLARNDYVEPPSAKRMRTEGGQRKYNSMLEARRKEAHERTRYINASLAIVVVLVSIIGIGVQGGRAKIAGDLTAVNVGVTNGVVYGKKAAATVDIFEDFQCPHCADFESSAHAVLAADVKANKAQVRYHPLAILDGSSNGNRYSSRAANAALCVSDVSVDAFVRFHDILFTKTVQPQQGNTGRTDADFVNYAQQAGLSPAQVTTFTTCLQSEQHKALVQAITDNASKRGLHITPTIRVNGKTLSKTGLSTLTAAIEAADANGPPPSPSPTPSPSPSPSKTGKPSVTNGKSPSTHASTSP